MLSGNTNTTEYIVTYTAFFYSKNKTDVSGKGPRVHVIIHWPLTRWDSFIWFEIADTGTLCMVALNRIHLWFEIADTGTLCIWSPKIEYTFGLRLQILVRYAWSPTIEYTFRIHISPLCGSDTLLCLIPYQVRLSEIGEACTSYPACGKKKERKVLHLEAGFYRYAYVVGKFVINYA